MTPERDPRSSPNRPKIDIKIDINFDAKTKRAGHGLIFVSCGRDPPGRRPKGSGEGAHTARERPPGTYAGGKRSKEVYNYTKYTVYRVQYTGYRVQVYWGQYTGY